MVDLEVASVDDRSQRGLDGDAHRVGDAVADAEPIGYETVAEPVVFARLNRFHRGIAYAPTPPRPDCDHAVGQPGCVHRDVQLR